MRLDLNAFEDLYELGLSEVKRDEAHRNSLENRYFHPSNSKEDDKFLNKLRKYAAPTCMAIGGCLRIASGISGIFLENPSIVAGLIYSSCAFLGIGTAAALYETTRHDSRACKE